VTVSEKASGAVLVAVAVADGSGVTEGAGDALRGATVALADGKTTRDGTQSRVARKTPRMKTARSASRASADTV